MRDGEVAERKRCKLRLRLRWRPVHAGATKPQGEWGSGCCVNAAVKRTRCVWQLFVGRLKRGYKGGGGLGKGQGEGYTHSSVYGRKQVPKHIIWFTTLPNRRPQKTRTSYRCPSLSHSFGTHTHTHAHTHTNAASPCARFVDAALLALLIFCLRKFSCHTGSAHSCFIQTFAINLDRNSSRLFEIFDIDILLNIYLCIANKSVSGTHLDDLKY